ncbi:hypothetical protein LY78DRAFT_722956 [Colletotrichum sublineola]|uniref:Uncharacterized protein n=1 Tax=Colletotrichum sublineola TaxID=1173701 RepID=A0A066XGC6_COLSU|nr:hypothetical protein LY78DRAFT_722956 [Colletotrichum sublineola]KDN66669.1 hypothetical protein CSUB01_07511 [Colletotrichum sublineola]
MISLINLAIVALAGTAAAAPYPEAQATATTSGGCTTTVTYYDAGFTGDWSPTMTSTVYSTTVTVTQPTDCHGCKYITSTTVRRPWWGGIGPMIPNIVYVSATMPATATTLVCATSTSTHSPSDTPTPTPTPGPTR